MNSAAYGIGQAVAGLVQGVATVQSAAFLDNPPLPLDPGGTPQRVLFVLRRGDRGLDQPGQRREKRQLRLMVGAAARTKTADADADALLFAARCALRTEAARAALKAAAAVGPVREVELEPELKDLAADGSVLLTAFEIDYFQTYPDAA